MKLSKYFSVNLTLKEMKVIEHTMYSSPFESREGYEEEFDTALEKIEQASDKLIEKNKKCVVM
jgi:hypothetical protein